MKKSLKLPEQYTVERLLGQGHRGQVYLVQNNETQQYFAVKYLEPRHEKPEVFKQVLQWSLSPYTQIEHPNLLHILELPESEEPCYAIELAQGQSLKEYLLDNGPLELTQALYIALQIASGLSALHDKALYHGNMRPSSLFISPSDNWSVKLGDFGLFSILYSSDPSFPSSVELDILPYLAPEQIQLPVKVDHRTDVYILGVLLYEMITGHPPFVGKDVPSLLMRIATEKPAAPSSLTQEHLDKAESIILQCLEKDRNLRYAHINILALKLEELYRRLMEDTAFPATESATFMPTPPEEPCLIKLDENKQFLTFRLPRKSGIIIGRSQEASIKLVSENDLDVSRKHAQMDYEGDTFWIKDLGSQNGVFVNQEKIESQISVPLTPQDQIQIGKNVFQFKYLMLNKLVDNPDEMPQEKGEPDD